MNLEPIFKAVRLAAVLCHEVQRHHIVQNQKSSQEPVTIADYGSQAILCEALSRVFPADAVLAEENGQQFMTLVKPEQREQITRLISAVLGQDVEEADVVRWLDFNRTTSSTAPRTWVIDPIDGTKGFLAMRHFVIALGFLEYGQPKAAIMGCPGYPGYEEQRGALFHTLDGKTYRQPMLNPAQPTQIFASKISDAAQVRVLESVEKSHASHDRMEKVRQAAGLSASQLERVDSQEKYARIAAGDGELYLRLPRLNSENRHMIWDHAAGAMLVYAAGGNVTDIDGSPLDFTQGQTMAKNQGMIVSNGIIHDQVLKAVEQVLEAEKQNPPTNP